MGKKKKRHTDKRQRHMEEIPFGEDEPIHVPALNETEVGTQLEQYRQRFLECIDEEAHAAGLFSMLMREVRKMKEDKKLPPAMMKELEEMVEEAVQKVKAVAQAEGRNLSRMSTDEMAKAVIGDVKEASHLFEERVDVSNIVLCKIPTAEITLHEYMPDLHLPSGDVGYKGGVARLALKIHAANNLKMPNAKALIDAEIPLTDKDAVVAKGEDMWKLAREMDVDPDGMEKMKDFDIKVYIATRDIDMNQVLLTKDYLYHTPEALKSIETGIIHGIDTGFQDLFGPSTFKKDGKTYFTHRILHRLVKAVCEGKADAFSIDVQNADVPLDIYWMVLLRKSMEKDSKGAKMLAALYECAVQMGQTSATDIGDFVKDLQEKYPQIDLLEEKQSEEEVAKWVLKKYINFIHKIIKKRFNIRYKAQTGLSKWGEEPVEDKKARYGEELFDDEEEEDRFEFDEYDTFQDDEWTDEKEDSYLTVKPEGAGFEEFWAENYISHIETKKEERRRYSVG